TRFSRDWSSDVCSSDLDAKDLNPRSVRVFKYTVARPPPLASRLRRCQECHVPGSARDALRTVVTSVFAFSRAVTGLGTEGRSDHGAGRGFPVTAQRPLRAVKRGEGSVPGREELGRRRGHRERRDRFPPSRPAAPVRMRSRAAPPGPDASTNTGGIRSSRITGKDLRVNPG